MSCLRQFALADSMKSSTANGHPAPVGVCEPRPSPERQLFTPAHHHPRRASETGAGAPELFACAARTSGDVRAESPPACYAKHGSFRQARPAELPNNTCV